jgi:hypothetical protein
MPTRSAPIPAPPEPQQSLVTGSRRPPLQRRFLPLLMLSLSATMPVLAAGPDFNQALDAAWLQAPEARISEFSRTAMNESRPDWISSRPSAYINYSQGKDSSAIAEEWQAGVSLNLTTIAGYQTRQSLTRLDDLAINNNISAQRWQWSGRLQDWWWNWQSLQVRQQRIQDQRQAMEQQLQWLDVLVQQGERPAFDRLPLQQALQRLKAEELVIKASSQQSQVSFQQWTGLQELPDSWQFSRASERPLDQHPLLGLHQLEQQQAELNQQLLAHQNFAPELTLGLRHVAAVDQLPAADLLQAGIRLPFGSSSYREQRDSIQQRGAAERLLLDTRQTLERERSSLAMQLPLLQQRWQELQQLSQQAMTQYDAQYQAWRQGSLPGFQWLQVQDSIWQLQQQADEARIQFSQSISHWNQLQGVLPE